MSTLFLVLVSEVSLGGGDDSTEILLVLALDVLEGQDSSGLLVNDGAETRFGFDDDVGNAHLAAESREVDDEFDGVDIVSNDDKGGLLGFD